MGFNLTERKKGDRVKMAAIIKGVCSELGATVETTTIAREIMLHIEGPRGLNVSIDFDGDSCQPDVFVNGWNIRRSDARLSSAFPGDVNPYHFSKSTTICYGFDDLCAHVRQVLEMANGGSCFSAEREAACIAKNGTWEESRARFASYIEEQRAGESAQ